MTTFVLVHGAWHGPWCWTHLQDRLEQRGHDVVAVDLHSDRAEATASDYISAVRAALAGQSGAVLVAHSMSGLIAPLVTDEPAVDRLVLLAAMVPRPGHSWLANGPAPFAPTMQKLSARMIFDEQARSSWTSEDASELFYGDCTAEAAAAAVSHLRPDASSIYSQVCPPLPQRRVPTTYVGCRLDRAINADFNAAVAAETLDADRVDIDTGHSPFWSAPDKLADQLESIDRRQSP